MIKATDRKLVVGLEIGTAKVAALVGEVLPDGMVNIIGVGSCPSRGMDKGGVNDLESVVKCVQRAIDQAELMADCQISSDVYKRQGWKMRNACRSQSWC